MTSNSKAFTNIKARLAMVVLPSADGHPRTGAHADHDADTENDAGNRPGKIQRGKAFCTDNPANEYAINKDVNAVNDHGGNGRNGIAPEQPKNGLCAQV